jgi:hypothetical protein
MGNSQGSYRTTPANLMRAYDKLPPVVRHALANAVFDYVPQPILTHIRRGDSPKKIAKEIARWDRELLERKPKRKRDGCGGAP